MPRWQHCKSQKSSNRHGSYHTATATTLLFASIFGTGKEESSGILPAAEFFNRVSHSATLAPDRRIGGAPKDTCHSTSVRSIECLDIWLCPFSWRRERNKQGSPLYNDSGAWPMG
ncbi:hypothetical protein MAP00_001453 [Monascus purpureus]|nr:hypothetical protein MAP00_001453 [Monascus purpureus]